MISTLITAETDAVATGRFHNHASGLVCDLGPQEFWELEGLLRNLEPLDTLGATLAPVASESGFERFVVPLGVDLRERLASLDDSEVREVAHAWWETSAELSRMKLSDVDRLLSDVVTLMRDSARSNTAPYLVVEN